MKNKLTCEVVQDLLPSYVEGLTSQVSNEAIHRHLEHCMVCKDIVKRMEIFEEAVNADEKKEIDFLKKNKKKNTEILLSSVAITLILSFFIGFIVMAYGNPVSHLLAKKAVKEYIAEEYAELDLSMTSVNYSLADEGYNVGVHVENSRDVWFFVYTDMKGNIRYDTYEEFVLSGRNTYSRVNANYSNKVDVLLKEKDFPYEYYSIWANLEHERIDIYRENEHEYSGKWYGMKTTILEIDKAYNTEELNELGKQYGHIDIMIEDEEASAEKMAEILLDTKAYFDEAGIAFFAIDVYLEEVLEQDSGDGIFIGNTMYVEEFLSSDIYEEGLVERVQKAYEDAENKRKEQYSSETHSFYGCCYGCMYKF